MSIISQIPKPSFIFDPSQANENRDVLTQIRRIAEETGQSSPAYTRTGPPDFVNKRTVNKAGILVEAPANVPAVSFDQAFNKGYLAEAGATNRAEYSRDLSQTFWGKIRADITGAKVTSLDGTTSMTPVVSTETSGAGAYFQRNVTITSGQTWSISAFVKKFGSDDTGVLRMLDGSATSDSVSVGYNLTSKTSALIGTPNAKFTNVRHGIKYLGKDIYLIELTATCAVTSLRSHFQPSDSESTVTATIGRGLYFDEIQIENSPVATSRIRTSGSTASRGADNLVFTDAQDIIGQQSGVMLVTFRKRNLGSSRRVIQLGLTGNDIRIVQATNNDIGFELRKTSESTRSTFIGSSFPESFGTVLAEYGNGILRISGRFGGEFQESQTTYSYTIPLLNTINIAGSPTANILNSIISRMYIWNNNAWLNNNLRELLTR